MRIEGNFVGLSVSFFLGVGATLLLIVFYQQTPSYYDGKLPDKLLSNSFSTSENVFSIKAENNENATHEAMFQDLAPLLRRAAMEDKTVIVTSLNWAFSQPDSLLDIFLESFQNGENIKHLLNHLIIVAFDARAFERCKLVHPYCFELKAKNISFEGAQLFMSPGYNELVWEKLKVQYYILEQGYNFFFTDVDIMWFRNPLKHVTAYADLTLSCDGFNGNPDDVENYPNTGLFYVKSSNRTAKMMQHWHKARRRFPPNMDQNIFNKVKHELVDSFGIKIQFVDTRYFGGFCNHGEDLNEISTMHSNCCIGLEKKVNDLRSILDDWKNYTSLSIEDRKKGLITWRVTGRCIH